MKMTRGEMQDLLVRFATQNPDYRAALLRNPKKVVAAQFQMELPGDLQVEILEETENKVFVVLPHILEEGAELANEDLEAMAGGNTVKGDAHCDRATASTVVEIQASLF
jgi:hypothetical protein